MSNKQYPFSQFLESLFRFLPAILVSILISLFPLCLTSSDLRYILSIFLFLFSVSFFVLLKYPSAEITFCKPCSFYRITDFVPITIVCLFILLNYIWLNNLFSFFIAIVIVFFVPGFSILRLLRFNAHNSFVEWVVLSFCCSLPVSSLLYTGSSLLDLQLRYPFLVVAFAVLALLPCLKHRSNVVSAKTVFENVNSSVHMGELLLWFAVPLFFAFSILTFYPNYLFSDMVTAYSSAILLNASPTAYYSSHPWFEYLWSDLYVLSQQSPDVFIAGLMSLSTVLLLGFYVLSRLYLRDIDSRAPIISTAFFFLSSGFGWVYYLTTKFGLELSNSSINEYSLLLSTSTVSYWDTWAGNASWLWLWFRAITVGGILFFVLLYLLRRNDLSKRNFFVISILSIVALGMIHFTELILYIVAIFAVVLLYNNLKLRLRDSVLALCLGTVTLFVVSSLVSLQASVYAVETSHFLAIIILSVVCLIFLRFSETFSYIRNLVNKITSPVLLLSIPFYLLILVYWILNPNLNAYYGGLSPVPWGLYPVLLGGCGLFGIIGGSIVAKKYQTHAVSIFIAVFISILIFGRILTWINVNIDYVSYNERRLMPFIHAGLSILASIVIIRLYPKYSKQQEDI